MRWSPDLSWRRKFAWLPTPVQTGMTYVTLWLEWYEERASTYGGVPERRLTPEAVEEEAKRRQYEEDRKFVEHLE